MVTSEKFEEKIDCQDYLIILLLLYRTTKVVTLGEGKKDSV